MAFGFSLQSFNSLQTGKCIQSISVVDHLVMFRKFQFPSNGKVYSKRIYLRTTFFPCPLVSIPFKRESVFKVINIATNESEKRVSIPFKRESVFKVYNLLEEIFRLWVSIPFKRESVFKVTMSKTPERKYMGFNSLQTGKCIQSLIK